VSYLVSVCPSCSETRYRSLKDITDPTVKLTASDFVALGDQPPGVDGEVATCYKCGGALKFGKEAAPTTSTAALDFSPEGRKARMTAAAARPLTPAASPAVTTLFAVGPDEAIQKFEEIAPMKYFIVTSKRIITVDVNSLLTEG
jgi:hypothetical protein